MDAVGVKKLPASAAFPSGLPEVLEASVALQRLSEGVSSDRSSGSISLLGITGVLELTITGPGAPVKTCDCKVGGSCECCSPRASASQSKKQGKERAVPRADDVTPRRDSEDAASRPASLAAIANSGHRRPVLPRPSPQRQSPPPGPIHDPSQPAHAHSNRHQAHNEHFYSPYGRAYDHAHGADIVSSEPTVPTSTVASSVHSSSEELYSDSPRDDLPEPPTQWSDASSPVLPDFIPSLCGCGPSCSCPGCIVHRGSAAQPSASNCLNPNDCAACFECNFLSTAANVAPGTALADFTDAQYQSIDEWVRQLSATTGYNPNEELPNIPADQSSSNNQQSYPSQAQRDVRYDPTLWQTYALWGSLQGQGAAQSECCGGRCQCAAGMCTCAADCCGCCTGCQCADCDHPGDTQINSGKTLTFAESGIRDPGCNGRGFVAAQPSSSVEPSYQPFGNSVASSSQSPDQIYDPALNIPRTVSRASSTSSHASSHRSHSSASSRGSAYVQPNSGETAAVQSCRTSMQNISTSPPPPQTHIPTAADQHRTLNTNFDFLL